MIAVNGIGNNCRDSVKEMESDVDPLMAAAFDLAGN